MTSLEFRFVSFAASKYSVSPRASQIPGSEEFIGFVKKSVTHAKRSKNINVVFLKQIILDNGKMMPNRVRSCYHTWKKWASFSTELAWTSNAEYLGGRGPRWCLFVKLAFVSCPRSKKCLYICSGMTPFISAGPLYRRNCWNSVGFFLSSCWRDFPFLVKSTGIYLGYMINFDDIGATDCALTRTLLAIDVRVHSHKNLLIIPRHTRGINSKGKKNGETIPTDKFSISDTPLECIDWLRWLKPADVLSWALTSWKTAFPHGSRRAIMDFSLFTKLHAGVSHLMHCVRTFIGRVKLSAWTSWSSRCYVFLTKFPGYSLISVRFCFPH